MTGKISWAILILPLLLLLGCEAGGISLPQVAPASLTPAPPRPTDTPVVRAPAEMASPTPTPPTRTPTATTAPQARLLLTLPDCPLGFWDPFERERQVMSVLDEPGIVTVQALDVTRVRLVYDPAQLNQEEAIRTFEIASGLEVIETER